MWNALKLLKMWEARQTEDSVAQGFKQHTTNFCGGMVFDRLKPGNQRSRYTDETVSPMSEALKTIYSLIWDDFCSWYLEWIKPGFESR